MPSVEEARDEYAWHAHSLLGYVGPRWPAGSAYGQWLANQTEALALAYDLAVAARHEVPWRFRQEVLWADRLMANRLRTTTHERP